VTASPSFGSRLSQGFKALSNFGEKARLPRAGVRGRGACFHHVDDPTKCEECSKRFRRWLSEAERRRRTALRYTLPNCDSPRQRPFVWIQLVEQAEAGL
jgi:hypothetical protein